MVQPRRPSGGERERVKRGQTRMFQDVLTISQMPAQVGVTNAIPAGPKCFPHQDGQNGGWKRAHSLKRTSDAPSFSARRNDDVGYFLQICSFASRYSAQFRIGWA